MNCKPGDLAVIVRPGTTSRNLGKIVRCIELVLCDEWMVEAMSPCHKTNGLFGTKGTIKDNRLRPIRDPGDDATDETINWLPVPHKETA